MTEYYPSNYIKESPIYFDQQRDVFTYLVHQLYANENAQKPIIIALQADIERLMIEPSSILDLISINWNTTASLQELRDVLKRKEIGMKRSLIPNAELLDEYQNLKRKHRSLANGITNILANITLPAKHSSAAIMPLNPEETKAIQGITYESYVSFVQEQKQELGYDFLHRLSMSPFKRSFANSSITVALIHDHLKRCVDVIRKYIHIILQTEDEILDEILEEYTQFIDWQKSHAATRTIEGKTKLFSVRTIFSTTKESADESSLASIAHFRWFKTEAELYIKAVQENSPVIPRVHWQNIARKKLDSELQRRNPINAGIQEIKELEFELDQCIKDITSLDFLSLQFENQVWHLQKKKTQLLAMQKELTAAMRYIEETPDIVQWQLDDSHKKFKTLLMLFMAHSPAQIQAKFEANNQKEIHWRLKDPVLQSSTIEHENKLSAQYNEVKEALEINTSIELAHTFLNRVVTLKKQNNQTYRKYFKKNTDGIVDITSLQECLSLSPIHLIPESWIPELSRFYTEDVYSLRKDEKWCLKLKNATADFEPLHFVNTHLEWDESIYDMHFSQQHQVASDIAKAILHISRSNVQVFNLGQKTICAFLPGIFYALLEEILVGKGWKKRSKGKEPVHLLTEIMLQEKGEKHIISIEDLFTIDEVSTDDQLALKNQLVLNHFTFHSLSIQSAIQSFTSAVEYVLVDINRKKSTEHVEG